MRPAAFFLHGRKAWVEDMNSKICAVKFFEKNGCRLKN